MQALNGLASLYGHLKRYAEAEETFLRALDIAPQYVEGHFNLGTLYAHTEDWVRAPGRLSVAGQQRDRLCVGRRPKRDPNPDSPLWPATQDNALKHLTIAKDLDPSHKGVATNLIVRAVSCSAEPRGGSRTLVTARPRLGCSHILA